MALWRDKGYHSLSKAIKAHVIQAVNHVSNFEDHIAQLAKSRRCIGVMCGHIHTAANRMIGEIHYLNSGDWVESPTAIVEYFNGRFEIIDFAEFRKRLPLADVSPDLDEPGPPAPLPEVAAEAVSWA